MIKSVRLLLNLVAFILFSFAGFILYWSVAPFSVVKIQEPIEILNANNEIAVGEPIKMRLLITKEREVAPKSSVFITCKSGNLVTMDARNTNLPIGEYEIISDRFLLPPKILSDDECKFNWRNTYQVNPFRTIIQQWSSETFKVIER